MLEIKLAQNSGNVVLTLSSSRVTSLSSSLSLSFSFFISSMRKLGRASLSHVPFLNHLIGIKKKMQLNRTEKKLYFDALVENVFFVWVMESGGQVGNTQTSARTSQGKLSLGTFTTGK